MADFGIQGFLVDWNTPNYIDEQRRVYEPLPDVFRTMWISDHMQHVPRVRLTRASA